MNKIKVVKEDVDPNILRLSNLTSDCMLVERTDGICDLVRSYKMVDVFDVYHDLGVGVRSIRLLGGSLNPKNHNPKV